LDPIASNRVLPEQKIEARLMMGVDSVEIFGRQSTAARQMREGAQLLDQYRD
jgi:hypothetical protein